MTLALLMSGAILAAPPLLATVDRAAPVQDDCIGKKRVLSGQPRAKRTDQRKRCHVMMPILM
ncbi:hypothetical protein [Blastomonas sp.]|uniref:hypothetical protein n=1 Tax=Blastomonas sp. TaxID=1909299 RepID=UPI00391D6805